MQSPLLGKLKKSVQFFIGRSVTVKVTGTLLEVD
jgi:hypothetical protein